MPLSYGQGYFRVISGVPHLPSVEPSTIVSPSPGMLIYSPSEKRPLVYTGSVWDGLCTGSFVGSASAHSFAVQEGIPYLPVLEAEPTGTAESGSLYFSRAESALKIQTGTGWSRLSQLKGISSAITQSSGFSANSSLKISRLPMLASDPAPIGLSSGAIYINATSRAIRYYNGSVWLEVGCTPVVSTLAIADFTNTQANSGALISSDGGSPVTLQGVVWNTTNNPLPDTTLSTKTREKVTGQITFPFTFPSTLKNLTASTTYYVRAYAVNSSGIAYGDVQTFKTAAASVPTIITLPGTERTPISASTGGDIPSTGGASVTERGIVWSTTQDPLLDTVALVVDPAAIKTRDGSGPGLFPTRLTNLIEGTTYYVRAYARNIIGVAYGQLEVFQTLAATPPVLSAPTINIYDITDTSAKTEVTILNNGGAEVEERGVAWSTLKITDWSYDNPDIIHNASTVVNPSDIGTFASELINLQPGTLYYVRAYAKNRVGVTYSSETSFLTTSLPTLTTLPASSIKGMTAVSGGEITSTGVSKVTERGIVWSTDPVFDPELVPAENKITHLVSETQRGVGLYYSNLTGLEPGTMYYVRAYATNSFGTSYGDTISFTTAARPQVVTYPEVVEITSTTASSGGSITDDGREWVYSKGVVWSTNPDPTLETGNIKSGGSGSDSFVSSLTGLMANTTYYVRAYATNSVGTAYGDNVEFTTSAPDLATLTTYSVVNIGATSAVGQGYISSHGGDTISSRGVCWSVNNMPTIADSYAESPVSGYGTGYFSVSMTGLVPNQIYYVRAFARNGAGVAYGNQVIFKTYTYPTVVTSKPSNVSSSKATGGGLIVSDGGTPVTKSGLVWSTSMNLNLQNATGSTTSGTGIGEFVHQLTDLLGNTKYYVRAYATNKTGTAYGSLDSLVTAPPVPPTLKTRAVADILLTTAMSGGDVSDNGGSPLLRTGLVWSTVSGFDPTAVPSTNRTIQADEGSFSSSMTGLNPGQQYFVRAYAENSIGIVYADNEESFMTLLLPTVETNPLVDQITSTSARSGGTISNDGGAPVSSNGVV
ncbi:hypothetical protein LN995_21200, partial [Pontibacter silvestris]|nr:hypothetical protein [Pontibacter silvestris]